MKKLGHSALGLPQKRLDFRERKAAGKVSLGIYRSYAFTANYPKLPDQIPSFV
jgi:hypothetical protein